MISRFTVKNYKNVNVEEIEFGQWNILIGPNNSGKTNLIRAISFLADMIKEKPDEGTTSLYETLSKRGWDRLLKFNSNSREIEFNWTFLSDSDVEPYKYILKLHIGDNISKRLDFYITEESLGYDKPKKGHDKSFNFYQCHNPIADEGYFSVFKKPDDRKKLKVRSNETAFLQLNELRLDDKTFDKDFNDIYAKSMNNLSKYFARFHNYTSSDFDLDSIKKPVSTKRISTSLDLKGTNLANLLLHWKHNEYKTFDEYRSMISPLFGTVLPLDLSVDPIIGTAEAQITVGVGKQKYLLGDLSDGTLKAMLLASLLVDRKDKMSVCAIDEPETNLHPEWQARFCDWLLSSSSSKQYFISTHSPEILDALTPAFTDGILKVFVLSEDGEIKLQSLKKVENLINNNFNLGDLYRAKAVEIGGWPK